MSCIITDIAVGGTGTPVVGATVVASPALEPMFQKVGGSFVGNVNPTISVVTNAQGQWSVTLPWPSESDPSSVKWTITMPDGYQWVGVVPEGVSGPISLHTLKDTHGWGLVYEPRETITAIQGPPGAAGIVSSVLPSLTITPTAAQRVVIYVRPTGSDTTGDGTTTGKAFRTVQKALDSIPTMQRGPRYVIDMTGINDAAQNIQFPQFVNSDGLTYNFADPVFYFEGYVTLYAAPTVLDTLNAGTTTITTDPISGLITITDTSKNWTPDAFVGKQLHSASLTGSGAIRGNTTTDLFVASSFALDGPLTIADYGATLNGTVNLNGVHATVVCAGINFDGDFCVRANMSDSVQFNACRLQKPLIGGGADVVITSCFIDGVSGAGPAINTKIGGDRVSMQYSFLKNVSLAAWSPQWGAGSCIFQNCRLFDTNAAASIGLGGCHILGQGLVFNGGVAFISNIRVDNAAALAHINPNGSAIVIMGGASVCFGEGVFGGSGSVGYGVEIIAQGCGWIETAEPVTLSITGALGDLRVGDNAVRTWADFTTNPPIMSESNLAHMARMGINVQGATVGAELLKYAPAAPSNYAAIPAPTNVAAALDRLAARNPVVLADGFTLGGNVVGVLVKHAAGGTVPVSPLTTTDDGSVALGVVVFTDGFVVKYEAVAGARVRLLSDGTAISRGLVYASGVVGGRVSSVPRGPAVGRALADVAAGAPTLVDAFLGSLASSSAPPATPPVGSMALQLLGGQGFEQGAHCGNFWPEPPTNLGPCLWEAWVQPYNAGSRIIIVDGYGGLHAILFEMNQAGPGSLNRVSGNMNFDAGSVSFTSYDGLWPNEAGHVAILYDMTNSVILLFVNGLCSGKFPTVGNRQSQGGGIGGGLVIGSYGHNGWDGLIQQIRGWDSVQTAPAKLPKVGGSYEIYPVGPESIFSPTIVDGDNTMNECHFLANLSEPAIIVNDLSPNGFLNRRHAGSLQNMTDAQNVTSGGANNIFPRPQFVASAQFPGQLVAATIAHPIINPPAPKTPPGGAKVFEGFTHGWNVQAWDNAMPSLPPTQGGTLGPLPWSCRSAYPGVNAAAPWGTDNSGNAVCMSTQRAIALVDVGTPDYDVRVSRVGPAVPDGLNGETGIAFRAVDDHNFYYVSAVYDPFNGNRMSLWLEKVTNGVDGAGDGGQSIDAVTPNDTWTTLRILVTGTTFKAFVDDGAGGWIQVGADMTLQTSYQAATKVGLFHTAGNEATGLTTRRRYTNFTVL